MNTALIEDPELNRYFTSRIPIGRWGNAAEIGQTGPLSVFFGSRVCNWHRHSCRRWLDGAVSSRPHLTGATAVPACGGLAGFAGWCTSFRLMSGQNSLSTWENESVPNCVASFTTLSVTVLDSGL